MERITLSWDAYLTDDRGHSEGEWNYTHNCNRMIETALGSEAVAETSAAWWASPDSGLGQRSWWRLLDGRSGQDGAALLEAVIIAMETDPEKYRAMNPPNGWGDYDSLLGVLRDMRSRVPEWPTEWRVHG